MIAFPVPERCARLGGKGWADAPGGYDAVVVGGGIYGAMVALEAARRGLRPLLLERDDFGQHTSWNSLRILHGGLRYLQSMDLSRSRQSAQERQWFLRSFPDLCRPLPCLMPLYGEGMKRPEIFRIALRMNDLVSAGLGSSLPRGRVLSAAQTVEMFPAVRRQGLRGAALWYDGTMPDSQRVIIETLRWATHLGARCINHVEVTGLLRGARGTIEGVRALDRRSGAEVEVRAPYVLNCAGPWARRLLEGIRQDQADLFRPALAFNLVINRQAPSTAAVAVSPAGGTTYFLTPWKGHMLAGTGHHPWTGPYPAEPGDIVPDAEQVDRFLADLNRAVPGLDLDRSDVRGCMAGLLPAAQPGQAEPSRRPIVLDHGQHGGPKGLVSVSGVKFTTARLVAEQAVRAAFGARADRVLPRAQAERPAPTPVLPTSAFVQTLRDDPMLARRELLRLMRDEAVWTLDDLLIRRTDWASCPVNGRAARDGVIALAERDPMLAGLAPRARVDRATA